MDGTDLKKLSDAGKIGMCRDFFPSFTRLPGSFQSLVIKMIVGLTEELSAAPDKAKVYDRDLASMGKYFPNTPEILESGDLFPFRFVRLPKSEENKDLVQINFLSCFLANRLGFPAITNAEFTRNGGNFDDNKILLISCIYISFDPYD